MRAAIVMCGRDGREADEIGVDVYVSGGRDMTSTTGGLMTRERGAAEVSSTE